MTQMNRRGFLATGALGIAAAGCAGVADGGQAKAVDPREDTFIVDINRSPDAEMSLWPGSPPGPSTQTLNQHYVERSNDFDLPDRAIYEVTDPGLSVFRAANGEGDAVLIIPGGGYNHVVVEKEGFEGARFFNQFGYDVFVMNYRLPYHGWQAGPDAPLQDAQRAVRLSRALMKKWGNADRQLSVMGFSAGGHLAGSLAQRFDDEVYSPVDDTDLFSARPDVAALIYPVVLMGSEFTHSGSQTRLLGSSPSAELLRKYDLTTAPNASGPDVFLMHALDDPAVPYENSLQLASAYRRAGVKAVLHSFEEGGHGFGLRGIEGHPRSIWPALFMAWAKAHRAAG